MVNPILKDILVDLVDTDFNEEYLSQPVGEMKLDSRKITNGDTFIAVKGFATDGRQFIEKAFQQGATLVIAESQDNLEFCEKLALASEDYLEKIVWINNLKGQLSKLAANYYHNPSYSLKVIGVTGTNGKTSCSYLIAKTLQQLHFECYLLGTLGVGQTNQLQSTETTTTDPITMQRVLAEALDAGAQFASMEISSHGIDQGRAQAVKLRTAVFTNLTRDHLDYHGTMESYGEAKRKLFLLPDLENAVINMDDKFGRKLAKDESIVATKWLTTTKLPTSGSNLNRWIWAENVDFSLAGIQAKIYTPWGSGELESPLIGAFNLSNLLMVIATLGSILKDVYPVLSALKRVRSAPGRMDKIGGEDTPLAIVDYAHTPDALEQTLLAIREHCVGLIWCVFGCGGDRDSGKRPLMARIAEKLANRVVVTNDNPRTESVEQIKNDIFTGFRKPEKAVFIADRETAIRETLAKAQVGDAVLIAGKGHEDYQIIGKEKFHLSDLDIATKAIEEMRS
ncbi:UDP-N-acetylmuramoyl-L-alanyl-D-glutamate--2,6-diaminopimelate ligase [Aliikangiella sp. G2MR2-5]|uniref:UDP-N-acetylmuramoyl-L-alanyl-D-glutamate--2, 6-diaminopimelate ligase n=1 Tax=Aliikangiella sp. G2MR2-5 TaxID=2788943 RepID=UPI0018AADBA2|nr:UDP-N-acetylmuramoyl-L-alanyl-D-glutamate--2,6-diaminopimelate ligase [Aliikangiella sp. G2MR2-5]